VAKQGLSPESVVHAGADMADEVGFDEVTVAALARRLGVRTASLYWHLQGSDDLRTRIALLAHEELADRAGEAVAGRAGKDALRALADVHRDYSVEHPGRWSAARHPLDPETAATSAGVRVAQLTRAVLRDYDLAEPEETHAVRLLGSVFLGFVTLERSGSFDHSEPGPAESWSRVVDALDALLRAWPSP
jgi:AcrR family transcriptional regulator